MSLLSLDRGLLRRIACAMVRAEVRRLRDNDPRGLALGDWPDDTLVDETGLGLDSLERLGALGALAQAFALRDDALPETPPRTVGDWIDWIERSHGNGLTSIAVSTSGSTGVPKTCKHIVAALGDEAAYFATQLPGRNRVVALVPAHHLYGLVWTAFLPKVLGVDVVERVLGSPIGFLPGDLVVAVPEQWEALLRMRTPVPDDCIAVSSAGVLSDDLAETLLRTGFVRVVDVYGSSETGAIAVREAPEVGYRLLPRWNRAEEGSQTHIVGDDACSVPLPDRVDWIDPRRLKPLGRLDFAVKVGGKTVWPERVARILRDAEGVADLAVRQGPNGRLKAFVVPARAADPDMVRNTLNEIAAARLMPAERPKGFTFGEALPRNELGKLADWK